MPTPSSNLAPEISFSSTCPDDQAQRSSSHGWHSSSSSQSPPDGMIEGPHVVDGSAGPVGAPTNTTATTPSVTDTLEDGLRSTLSSRSATLSPDTVPDGPSPLPSGGDLDSMKQTDTEEETQVQSKRTSMTRLGVDGLVSRRGHARNDTRSSFATDDRGIDIMSMDFWDADLSLPSISAEFSNLRVIPSSPSSYLRPGSKFHGTQQSERQVYDVQVEIKHVDLRESFLCGYLRIQGLTEDHPTLTTYFEGEIIGTKYSFITKHESWGATDKIDLSHWGKFNAFRPYQKQARKGPVLIRDVAQRENIFMRWKEHFLVPDHRVRTINGASFEGFYYICFNQVKGEVSGIYFHSKSEKFQQLELKHVEDRGCFSAIEFR